MMKEFFITEIPRGELVDSVSRRLIACVYMYMYVCMYICVM